MFDHFYDAWIWVFCVAGAIPDGRMEGAQGFGQVSRDEVKRAVDHIIRVSRERVDWQPGEHERVEAAGDIVRREEWRE